MGVTVQVRDLDPIVNDRLKNAAASRGLSYSEYLRRELTRIAERLRIEERWDELRVMHEARVAESAGDGLLPAGRKFTTEEIIEAIHEGREGR